MKVNADLNNKGFDVEHQIEMVGDKDRVKAICLALTEAKADSFLEIGYGSGLFLNKYKDKFSMVTGIDVDDSFSEYIDDGVKLIKGDYLNDDFVIQDKFDVILSETCSTWGVEEDYVKIMNKAINNNLKDNGAIIPCAQINFIEGGYVNHGNGLSGVRYLEFSRILNKFKAITNREVFTVYDFDFFKNLTDMGIDREIIIKNPASLEVNAIKLSTTQIFGKENFLEARDSINAPIIIPIPAIDSEIIKINISFRFSTNINEIIITAVAYQEI
jgi:predicted RNA methylase